MQRTKQLFQDLLDVAGITINGEGEADIQVHNTRLYREVLRRGSLGLGEAYMDGWWDARRLDLFFYKVLRAALDEKVNARKLLPHILKAKLLNAGRKSKAFEIGEKHYDIGNLLFEHMLDKRMVYSGGYWKDAGNLDEAQEAKLDLICRKLGLKPGMKVLDIGCGWGSFCKYAAEKYDADVIGITVSKEQVEMGNQLCKGLNVKILLQDYRTLDTDKLLGKDTLFDRAVSVGMIEHVGYKNYALYMQTIRRMLHEDGIFLLQTIGGNSSSVTADPWINKYIFPVGMLPSIKQIGNSIENVFVMEDWHNFGTDYDKTLMAWHQNFEQSWEELKAVYDDRFYRMWKYYLLSCAGSFRARKNQLWQIVLSKNGIVEGYQPVR
ncbi:MAG: cyclopropane fatty acyl phospholipid synthase [Bacteroidales bacterium]